MPLEVAPGTSLEDRLCERGFSWTLFDSYREKEIIRGMTNCLTIQVLLIVTILNKKLKFCKFVTFEKKKFTKCFLTYMEMFFNICGEYFKLIQHAYLDKCKLPERNKCAKVFCYWLSISSG